MTAKAGHLIAGADAENTACAYLKNRGLRLIDRNCRSPYGEIDLIMNDNETLVFIEVRYRKDTRYGLAQETIGPGKQQRVIRSAQWYLQQNSKLSDRVCRFDIIAITGDDKNRSISWIPNAFC